MLWNKIFLSTIHEHEDLRCTHSHKENVCKTLVLFYSWLPFPSHQPVTREAVLALKENSNRLSATLVWSSASYGRESTGGTKKIEYRTFIWGFLRQEEEMQASRTSPYPYVCPLAHREQVKASRTKQKNTDLERIMVGSRNTSPTLRSAITNQLYDQLLLNYQIDQVNQSWSFILVM